MDLQHGCGGDASVNADAVDNNNGNGNGGNSGNSVGRRDLVLALAQPYPLDLSFALSGTRTATLHRDTKLQVMNVFRGQAPLHDQGRALVAHGLS
jgi:hypothetical protein